MSSFPSLTDLAMSEEEVETFIGIRLRKICFPFGVYGIIIGRLVDQTKRYHLCQSGWETPPLSMS